MHFIKYLNRFGLTTLLTVANIMTLSAPTFASAPSCESLFKTEPIFKNIVKATSYKEYDQYPQFNYDQFQNILFLSDGGKAGRNLKETKKPSQLVVSSDYRLADGVNIRVDNNQLPFRNNSFDLIIMNRGLCPCHSPIACGGIDTKKEPMKKFLISVIDILDKKNPDSLALVTGFYFPGLFRKTVPELWLSVVYEMQVIFPELQFAILQSDAQSTSVIDGFIGIAISTNTLVPVEQRLQQLKSDLVKTSVIP